MTINKYTINERITGPYLQDTSGLLIYHGGDTLDTATAGKTTNGRLGDALDVPIEGLRRGGLGVGIDHNDPIVGQNHRSVGIHLVPRRGNSSVHSVRHLLEVEEIFVGGLGVSHEHAAGIDVLERLDGRRRDTNVR